MEEVAKYESAPLTANDIKSQVALIQDVMKTVMLKGEHYGVIPGCGDKPALLKPGAEKLNLTFRMAPDPQTEVVDLGSGHREYRVKCEMRSIKAGQLLGAGVGSASTMETKWRYRNAEPEITNKLVPKEYWDIRKNDPAKALEMIGGKGFITKKVEGNWYIAKLTGEKVEYDNPADYYNCVTPETKILTHDLQWIPAGDIETGDVLIGVEEQMTNQYSRNLAIGEATIYGRKEDTIYELMLDDGRIVRSNSEHQWLVKKIGLKGTEWISTQEIYNEITAREGRPRHWSIMSLCMPWKEDKSKEAGYLAGLLDADGSLGTNQVTVLFAQQDNCVLGRMESGLEARGYTFGKDRCKTTEELERCESKKQVYALRIHGGFPEQMRLLGSIRPPRLLDRWLTLIDLRQRRLEGRGSGAGSPVLIKKIECLGIEEIVLLGSSCGTYVAEGLIAHNTCWKMAKKRALVDAVLTVTAASDIFTQDVEEMVENGTITPPPETKPPLQEPQKKTNGETKAPEEPTEVQVLVKNVTLKTGKGDKGEWTLYKIITVDDLTYQTFNKEFGEIAVQEKSTGMPIIIEFKPKDFKGKDGKIIQGKEIVSLTRSEALPIEKDEIPF